MSKTALTVTIPTNQGKKGGTGMITLFDVNDIAILSKSDPFNNILRFSPKRNFQIPEENKKLIERILSEDITATDETDLPDIIKQIISYQPFNSYQVETIQQLCWSVGIYPQTIIQPELYDYCFNQWTKNNAGVIQITENGILINGNIFINNADFNFNLKSIFTIAIEFAITKPTIGNKIIIFFGPNHTQNQTSANFSIEFETISIKDSETIDVIASIAYRTTAGGTRTVKKFNYIENPETYELRQIKLNQPQQMYITGDGTNFYAHWFGTNVANFFPETTAPSHKYTRCRIGTAITYSPPFTKDYSLRIFKYSNKFNDINTDFNENCLYYLNFMKE